MLSRSMLAGASDVLTRGSGGHTANSELHMVGTVRSKPGATGEESLPGSLIDRLFGSDGPVTVTLH